MHNQFCWLPEQSAEGALHQYKQGQRSAARTQQKGRSRLFDETGPFLKLS